MKANKGRSEKSQIAVRMAWHRGNSYHRLLAHPRELRRHSVSPYLLSGALLEKQSAALGSCLSQTVRYTSIVGDMRADLPEETFDSLLDLLRRLPPTRIEQNVNTLCDLCPDYVDDLLGNVDQPLKVLRDEEKGREFLGCDYNRDGDSFR